MANNQLSKNQKSIKSIYVGLYLAFIAGIQIFYMITAKFSNITLSIIAYIILCMSLVISAFVINLAMPVSTNRRNALIVAIPTFLVLFYFFTIHTFVFDQISPGEPRDIWYKIEVGCISGPLIELFISGLVALSGWLGTQIIRRIQKPT